MRTWWPWGRWAPLLTRPSCPCRPRKWTVSSKRSTSWRCTGEWRSCWARWSCPSSSGCTLCQAVSLSAIWRWAGQDYWRLHTLGLSFYRLFADDLFTLCHGMHTISDKNMCDPWQTQIFLSAILGGSAGRGCAHCLPDCVSTTYTSSVSATPLRR